jgi:hypothetical protein
MDSGWMRGMLSAILSAEGGNVVVIGSVRLC